jgi:SAM-dependent methyltransferase
VASDPDELRAEQVDRWETVAAGWRRRATSVRDSGMPVSLWMLEHLTLQPGETVLELAAGPGDTGLMAAELVAPGGKLISSDASEKMLAIARDRAAAQGIGNVEFKLLELEWIDLETASVDAVICRWGVMLSVDPAAALQECRRVLRPGGRLAVAVWDEPRLNPWATVPNELLVELGHLPPPNPSLPGPFALSAPGQLAELLQDAGFIEPLVEPVAADRYYAGFEDFLDEMLDLSFVLGSTWSRLSEAEQAGLMQELEVRTAPFRGDDGSLRLPGTSLAALAQA